MCHYINYVMSHSEYVCVQVRTPAQLCIFIFYVWCLLSAPTTWYGGNAGISGKTTRRKELLTD